MKKTSLFGLLMLVLCGVAPAQQTPAPSKEGTRDLPFFAPAPKEVLPPLRRNPAPAVKTTPPAGGEKRPVPPVQNPIIRSSPVKDMATLHLGLRYTLLIAPNKGPDQPVDPDRPFRNGECVAMELEANRSAYLYVFAKQSSGHWQPLFPHPELADERNVIDPGQKVRTPREACFEIANPPGSETLFVVLSREPRDIDDLQDAIRANEEKDSPAQMASADRLKSAVERMDHQFGTRDLAVRRPAKTSANEPGEKSVYVVNSSNKPTATLVTKIEIRHR
jgi:hypothetical protein